MQSILEYIRKTKTSNYIDTDVLQDRSKLESILKQSGYKYLKTDHSFATFLKRYSSNNRDIRYYTTGKYLSDDVLSQWVVITNGKILLFIRTVDVSKRFLRQYYYIDNKASRKPHEIDADGCVNMLTKMIE